MRKYSFIILFFLFAPVTAGETIQKFVPGSYQKILQAYKGESFAMVLWSLDCPPCYKELATLGRLRQQKKINLVLISTDDSANQKELLNVLENSQLQQADVWVFSQGQAERLRYEIDNHWYGELPRSYLFSRNHQRQALSGVLSDKALTDWLKNNH